MENRHTQTARMFKAFCDENRLQIIELLRSGEKCACELLKDMHIIQPTLSHHMKILCNSGIVIARREGKWTHYSISADGASAALSLLEEMTTVTESKRKAEIVCG